MMEPLEYCPYDTRSRRNTLPRAYSTPRAILAISLSLTTLFSLGIDVPSLAAATAEKKKITQDPVLKGLPVTELSEDEAILHALNRLAYGPRPGDIERIKQMGLARWIDQQLNPKSIDDSAIEARLSVYPTLKMSNAELLAEYPRPKQAAKQEQRTSNQDQKRGDAASELAALDMQAKSAPVDPVRQASQNADAAITSLAQEMDSSSPTAKPSAASEPGAAVESNSQPSPMKMDPATRGGGKESLSLDPNAVPRALSDDSKRPARVTEELAMAKTLRAIYSERQLQQVLDDFWFNHFNVYADKGEDRWYLTSYERDVIQPHAIGKFHDLLAGTAQSPAMLFYLDNFLSADPNASKRQAEQRSMRQRMHPRPFGYPPQPQVQQGQNKKQQRGLNENYGRELMELHTLGVDGGYTQKDVTEVARCFTGWTIEKPREEAKFKFDERLHDPNPKVVLGKKIHAGGMKDGEEALTLLGKNPNTARFISTKLARRFVSDAPPPALVERMAKSFQKSDGDIREVMHTMIYSPEFWSRDAYRAKVKTPFELVISSIRALGTDVDTPLPLVRWVGRIGEPLYQCQPPTGYSDKGESWVNTGALLNRLNFSLALSGNKVRGSRSDVTALLGANSTGDPKQALDHAVQVFLDGQMSANTATIIQKQLENPEIVQAKLDDPVKQVDLGLVTGLVLGAPEFQRR